MSRFPSQKQLMLGVLLVSGVLVMALASPAARAPEHSIFGPLAVKKTAPKKQRQASNYQRGKDTKAASSALRYKVQRRKENPFFSLYKPEQVQVASSGKAAPRTPPSKKHPQAFFEVKNSDAAAQSLFSAVFREPQTVQSGKALRLFLEQSMPSLKLKAGTLLKGIPHLAGDRIKITITAAQVGGTMQPIQLVCLDQEDCLEGLYHDVLAARMERAAQEGIIEELWGLSKSEALQQGRRIARQLTSGWQNMVIESGRKVFVMRPLDPS